MSYNEALKTELNRARIRALRYKAKKDNVDEILTAQEKRKTGRCKAMEQELHDEYCEYEKKESYYLLMAARIKEELTQ